MEAPALNAAQYLNQDSGIVDYYTPAWIVEAAREVMGGIDLDPASSPIANARVQAQRYFTEAEDGLSQPWAGRIWLNHPFGRGANARWIDKLVEEFNAGNVTQACCITYASTSEQWFRPLMHFPICWLHGRTNYLLPDGTIKRGVTKGSCVTYMGPNVRAFGRAFSPHGTVMLPYAPGLRTSPNL